MILPTAANITVATGDVLEMIGLGSSNWRCVNFSRASGKAVGLFNVDNTSDASKPISTAQAAVNVNPAYGSTISSNVESRAQAWADSKVSTLVSTPATFYSNLQVNGSVVANANITASGSLATAGNVIITGVGYNGGVYSTPTFSCNPAWGNVYFQGIHVPGAWAGGRIAANSQFWDFRDNGTAYGAAWTATSDRRLKENITAIKEPLVKLAQLQGYTYDRPDMAGLDGSIPRNAGLIAQELELVLPECVHTENDEFGKKSVDYNGPIALLVAGVNALQEKIAVLEAANDDLMNRLQSLEG